MAFKVAQLAKDLGIKSKQITELMTARGLECKTTQKSLDAKEFDIVFEALTREKQITDIDAYLFGDTYIPTVEIAKPARKKAAAETAPAVQIRPAGEIASSNLRKIHNITPARGRKNRIRR